MEYLSLLMLPYRCDGCKQIVTDEDYKPIYLFHLPLILLIKLIISESNFCLSKSAPLDLSVTSCKARSPMTYKLFSSLLNSISLEFYDEIFFVEKFIWAKSFLGLPDGDTLDFFLYTWAVCTVAIDKDNMCVRSIQNFSTICFCCHIIGNFAVCGKSFYPIRLNLPVFLSFSSILDKVELFTIYC